MAQDSDSASSTVPLMRAASQVWGAVHRGMDKDVWMVVTPYGSHFPTEIMDLKSFMHNHFFIVLAGPCLGVGSISRY